MNTQYYEIYAGGKKSGELVIRSRKKTDENGIVIMNEDEYDESFSRRGRECRGMDEYHEGYGVTTYRDLVAIHPAELSTEIIEHALGK